MPEMVAVKYSLEEDEGLCGCFFGFILRGRVVILVRLLGGLIAKTEFGVLSGILVRDCWRCS